MVDVILIVGGILFLIGFWALFYCFIVRREKRKAKKLLKNYDEKEDLSKQGEIRRGSFYQELATRTPELNGGQSSSEESIEPIGREVLSTTDVSSTPKNSKRTRGIIRKLRRR